MILVRTDQPCLRAGCHNACGHCAHRWRNGTIAGGLRGCDGRIKKEGSIVYASGKKSSDKAHRGVGASTGWQNRFGWRCSSVVGCFCGRQSLRGGPTARRDEGGGEAHGQPGPWRVGRRLTKEGVDDSVSSRFQ
jgi:hypothetical protein